MDIIERLTSGLNEKQLEAVEATEGFVRVIAGAGSGKTKALTSRFGYIVEALGIHPSNILCVTFTNKAAQEMKKRVKKMIGDQTDVSLITTYHGFCVRVLREDIHRLQYPRNFVILDTEDQKTILREVFEELKLSSRVLTFKQALIYISQQKVDGDYLPYLLEGKTGGGVKDVDKVFYKYMEKQRRNFALDFDDLINFTLHLYQHHAEALQKWQEKIHYIQVDETQDSSFKQFHLLELLAEVHQNMFVVGDPDQTIYEWRGADPKILVDFDKRFTDAQTIILNQNYRSTPNILSIGNHIIKNNSIRVEKEMFTQNENGVEAVHYHAKNEIEEGRWVTQEIKRLIKEQGITFNDVAILYRANFVARAIEQAFIQENIPYAVFGGIRFFERKEIKDILAYLRLLVFGDDFSFLRVINSPPRGLGKKFKENLTHIANQDNSSLLEALVKNAHLKELNRKGALEFLNMMHQINQKKDGMRLPDIIQMILDESGMINGLKADGDTDRLDNIKELQSSILMQEKERKEKIKLEEYLQEIALYTNMDVADDEHDKVKLMTIHTSKGLEFPYVFLCGFTEGVLPSAMSINDRGAKAIEEERRLTYVAITRAEKALYMTESEGYNFTTGLNKLPSRFLFEIDDKFYIKKGKKLSADVISDAKMVSAKPHVEDADVVRFTKGTEVDHPIFKRGEIMDVDTRKGVYKVAFYALGKIKPISFDFKKLVRVGEED